MRNSILLATCRYNSKWYTRNIMSEHYISAKQVQDRLQRSERQIRNYAAAGRIRTIRRAGRVLYSSDDVDKLSSEIRPEGPPPAVEVMPPGELLNHIRELEARLQQAGTEIGYLRGLLESKELEVKSAHETRKLLSAKETEVATLQQQLTDLQGDSNQRKTIIIGLFILVALLAIAVITIALIR